MSCQSGFNMTTQYIDQNSSYIFWLFDWGVSRVYDVFRYYPLYVRCDIDERGIRINLDPQVITITYDQILVCEAYHFTQSRSAGTSFNVKIILHQNSQIKKGDSASNEIYLVPVNMFANEPSISEINDMVSIVNTFTNHNEPSIPKNPYQRELIRRDRAAEFSEATWNALTPPNVYTPIPSFGRKLLMILLIVFGVSLIGLIAIAIIYNLLHYLFH